MVICDSRYPYSFRILFVNPISHVEATNCGLIDRCWWQRWRWRWYAVWSCCQGLYDGLFFEHSFEAAKVSQRADVPSRSKLCIWIYLIMIYNTSQSVYNHLIYIDIYIILYKSTVLCRFVFANNYAGNLTYVDANVGCWFVFEVSQLPWNKRCGLYRRLFWAEIWIIWISLLSVWDITPFHTITPFKTDIGNFKVKQVASLEDHFPFWNTWMFRFQRGLVSSYGCFQKIGVPQNGWFIMDNPIKMDDLGVPQFLETSIYCICTPVFAELLPPPLPHTTNISNPNNTGGSGSCSCKEPQDQGAYGHTSTQNNLTFLVSEDYILSAPSNGWCLDPKGLQNGNLYHPFGALWRVQVYLWSFEFGLLINDLQLPLYWILNSA